MILEHNCYTVTSRAYFTNNSLLNNSVVLVKALHWFRCITYYISNTRDQKQKSRLITSPADITIIKYNLKNNVYKVEIE